MMQIMIGKLWNQGRVVLIYVISLIVEDLLIRKNRNNYWSRFLGT